MGMLSMTGAKDLAVDILLNIDGVIHSSQAHILAEHYQSNRSGQGLWRQLNAPGTGAEWERIRAKHWSPGWIGNLGLIEVDKHIYRMNDLKARRGHKPPKKRKTVLVKVGEEFTKGTYCDENNSWLVNGQFVKPKEVTWYKEEKPSSKMVTGSAKDAKPTQ